MVEYGGNVTVVIVQRFRFSRSSNIFITQLTFRLYYISRMVGLMMSWHIFPGPFMILVCRSYHKLEHVLRITTQLGV